MEKKWSLSKQFVCNLSTMDGLTSMAVFVYVAELKD